MSMLLMVKAMKTKVGNPLRKLVLIKLADNANDNGECWPSYQHIADQCEISTRSVMRHVDALCEAGLLCKEHRPGPKGNSSNMYTLSFDGVTESHKGSDRESQGGSDRESPRTSHSLESVNESSCRQEAGDGYRFRFSEIRDAYNRICAPILPACRADTAIRKAQARRMVDLEFNGKRPFREHGLPMWESYFRDCLTNKHWIGENDRGWRADFDFVTNPKNAIKLLERICG